MWFFWWQQVETKFLVFLYKTPQGRFLSYSLRPGVPCCKRRWPTPKPSVPRWVQAAPGATFLGPRMLEPLVGLAANPLAR